MKVEVHLPDYAIGQDKYVIVYEKQVDKYTTDISFGEECDTEEECKEILRKKGIHEYYLVYFCGKWIEKKMNIEGGEE